ncbi:MAG: methylated-DNA--[protein]-cysteine S-methyltransferase [Candidatus Bathyarchaeia archaeon]
MERVYCAGIATPIGRIWVAATEAGLFQIDFPRPRAAFLDSIRRRIDAEIVHDPDRFDALGEMFEDYFNGERVDYDLPFDLRGTDFQKAVWRGIHEIPYGRLSSYGRLAARIGRPRAARAVGNACGANPLAIVIPCHRVVRSDGSIGGFGGSPELKRYLLNLEGVLPGAEGGGPRPLEREYPRTREDLLRFFFE